MFYTASMILATLHILVSVLLIVCIVLQNRSSGLSAALSGQAGSTNIVQRRGAEKLIYKLTIWLAVAFFLLPIIRWFVTF